MSTAAETPQKVTVQDERDADYSDIHRGDCFHGARIWTVVCDISRRTAKERDAEGDFI